MLGMAEVSGHLGIECGLGDTFGQLLEQAALAEDVFRATATLKLIADEVV
jgi:hypothetical protein